MTRAFWLATIAIVAGPVVFLDSAMAARQQSPAAARWITAWGTSQQGLGTTPVTNATVRMIARVTVSGEAVRIRLDNTFGTTPLVVGRRTWGSGFKGLRWRQVQIDRSPSSPPRASLFPLAARPRATRCR